MWVGDYIHYADHAYDGHVISCDNYGDVNIEHNDGYYFSKSSCCITGK